MGCVTNTQRDSCMVAMRCAVVLAVACASACASSAHTSYFQLFNGSVINGCCPAPGKGSADGSVVYGGNVSDCECIMQ